VQDEQSYSPAVIPRELGTGSPTVRIASRSPVSEGSGRASTTERPVVLLP
jgi:hypothetical protein